MEGATVTEVGIDPTSPQDSELQYLALGSYVLCLAQVHVSLANVTYKVNVWANVSLLPFLFACINAYCNCRAPSYYKTLWNPVNVDNYFCWKSSLLSIYHV